MAHLGPPPLEGMEDKYGQEGLKNKSDLKKLKQELGDLESEQQLVLEKLATMQKEKLTCAVKEEEVIKFPVKGVEQSIFRRDFKTQGVVGDPGQKEKLGYQALISQIEAGLTKGYSDKEVVSVVVRAVQPGLQLRRYLETMVDLTLPRLCKAIKELSKRESFKETGLGDAQDSGVYASHISPRQQERVAKLVGKKCSVKCYLDKKPTEALWDTGAQV